MTKAQLDVLMKDWEKLTKEKLSKVPALKNLMEKYPLVLLHSRRYANLVGDGYGASAYSFNYKATDEVKHKVDIQLLFDNGRGDNTFEIISCVDDQNLIADLGEVDFTKDPDVKKISLEGYGLNSWDPKNKKVLDGHVYVERVRDRQGNKFYVLFKIVAVDKASRYTAFVWRFLPGAKIVKTP